MDFASITSLALDILTVIGSSAVVAAVVPSRILGVLNPVLQLLAANLGQAKNGK